VPLSVFLSGTEALLRYPGTNWDPGVEVAVSYAGQERVGEDLCHLLVLTYKHKGSGEPLGKWALWICPKRNYIPAKVANYRYTWSKNQPSGVGRVERWCELEPGLSFPAKIRFDAYLVTRLKREGRQVLKWRREYTVERVSLEPNYPLSFFQDVEFPDGTPIYEIVDGKIVRSYVKGKGRGEGAARRWLAPLALTLLALIGLAVAAFCFWPRRSRAA